MLGWSRRGLDQQDYQDWAALWCLCGVSPGVSPDWAEDPASNCALETLIAAHLFGWFHSLCITWWWDPNEIVFLLPSTAWSMAFHCSWLQRKQIRWGVYSFGTQCVFLTVFLDAFPSLFQAPFFWYGKEETSGGGAHCLSTGGPDVFYRAHDGFVPNWMEVTGEFSETDMAKLVGYLVEYNSAIQCWRDL